MQNFEVGSHEEQTQPGDSVVVIGGGSGVSALAAADCVGQNGHVTIYEAASDLEESLKESIAINGMSERVSVIPKPVGRPGENFWGSIVESEAVAPDELPDVDVLELDCEGVELDILRGLSQRPRIIIVEVHPVFGVKSEDVRSWLLESGYEIVNHTPQHTDADVEWYLAKLTEN